MGLSILTLGSLKNLIFREGHEKSIFRKGLPKKGVDSDRFRRGLGK